MNAHSKLLYSYTVDHNGTLIYNIINNFNHITLNTATPTHILSIDFTSMSSTYYKNKIWNSKYSLISG